MQIYLSGILDIGPFFFAFACKGEALDCNPLGYHGNPKGYNLVLCTSMVVRKKKREIVTRRREKKRAFCFLSYAPEKGAYYFFQIFDFRRDHSAHLEGA